METPKQSYLQAAKRVLRFVKGSFIVGILYNREDKVDLLGFSDSDWAGDVEERKSTVGFFFQLGSGDFFWSSKKQQAITLSSTEAEYMSSARAST